MNRSRVAAICIGITALVVSIAPGSALARQGVSVSRQAAAPVFSFPTNGTSYPSNGPYVFQLQPVSGAKGYLWSFVQNGMAVYQNLAWDGHLSPSNYTVSTNSKAHSLIHPGDLHVWVRALMNNGQWSATGAVLVRIQGKGGPSPKPTGTPTHPTPGTVLYQADTAGGFDTWHGSRDWKTLNGTLLNDGTAQMNKITAPTSVGVADYAVEAEIQASGHFGLFARYQQNEKGYSAFLCHESDYEADALGLWEGNPSDFCSGNYAGSVLKYMDKTYNLDSNYHVYRLEVQGNNVRLLVDGALVLDVTDNRHLSGGVVGLWDSHAQISVRSFKVIAL